MVLIASAEGTDPQPGGSATNGDLVY